MHNLVCQHHLNRRGHHMKTIPMIAAGLLSMTAVASTAHAQQLRATALGACDKTTIAVHASCNLSANADYNLSLGKCENDSSSSAKQKCQDNAARFLAEGTALCTAQAKGRQSVCNGLGQAAFDPKINPADFSSNVTNRFFPLKPGTVQVYKSGNSEVTVTVTSKTFKVAGVDCIVVHDVNRVDGEIEEDTLDYYAQDSKGNVWYFGEDTVSYQDGIADTHGSWRAGLNGARPGIIMPAQPALNKLGRLEFLLGEAEDMAVFIGKGETVDVPFGIFKNALKSRETTPIEPELLEHKYYVPGIGIVLSVNVRTGEREALVDFTPGS